MVESMVLCVAALLFFVVPVSGLEESAIAQNSPQGDIHHRHVPKPEVNRNAPISILLMH